MAKKKKRGGARKGAGRKKNPVEKVKITISVPVVCAEEIREKAKKHGQACEKRCRRKL